jgi:hypothetical protein
MQILVNGKTYKSQGAGVDHSSQSFGQVMENVSSELLSSGQLVTKLMVDGGDVTGEDRDTIDKRCDIDLIEITSLSPADLLRNSLAVIDEWLEPMRRMILKSADEYRLGNDAVAVESLLQVIEGFRLLMVGISQVLRLMQMHFPERNRETIIEFQNDFSRHLDDIIEAQKNQDLIMLADLLEYEIIENLDGWAKVSSELCGQRSE